MTLRYIALMTPFLVLLGCQKDLPPEQKLALFKAVEAGDADTLQKALNAGISPNLYHSERGYLIFAATVSDEVKPLEILIKAGADVNSRKKEGDGPLIGTFLSGRCEQSRLLLSAGATPEDRFDTAREAAAGSEYQNKSARQLYYLYKEKFPNQWERKKACWLDVERMMK